MKHKKRLSGRFLAFLLTAVLVLSSLSLSAFAGTSDDESADAEAAVVATETVTASEDEAAEETEEDFSEYDISTAADGDTETDSSGTTYTEKSFTYNSYSGWDENATTYKILTGVYYKVTSNNTTNYYQVYYIYGTTTENDQTNYYITLYYRTGENSYTQISTVLYKYGPNAENSVTLYTTSEFSDENSDDEESGSGDIDISAYDSTGLVYWDLDDSSESKSDESNYISSVQLTNGTTNTTYSVTFGESTDTSFGWSGGTVLSNIYDATDGTEATDEAVLTITPVSGYYVTRVIITCAALSGGSTRISPYNCSTYTAGKAFDESFTLSSASGSSYSVSANVANKYFAHNGYLQSHTDDEIYFILIEVEKIPTPAYVEYDYGDIVDDISDYNEENGYSSANDDGYVDSTIFTSNASEWTKEYNGNVYTDSSGTSYSGTVTGTGGVMTNYTQYEYVYDDSENNTTKGSSAWEHFANSINNDAVSAAASAGYVFAGWAVTWYAKAEVASTDSGFTKTESNYNYYTISFGSELYTGLCTEGSEVQIAGHVRLVAQWVKADDFTQVIDYGLPVSLDVIDELEEAGSITLEAITGNVSSRTSSSTSYDDADTEELNTTATISYVVKDEDEDDSTGAGEGDETETAAEEDTGNDASDTTSAKGEYGTFSVDDDDDEAIYTLSEQMTGVESMTYQVSLAYTSSGSGSSAASIVVAQPTGTISIVPATSMYYEENFGTAVSSDDEKTISYGLITYSNQTATWSSTGTALTNYQETGLVGDTTNSTYGTDTVYLNNLGDSYGTSMYVDTSNAAAQFSYTFTGTGTAIYARTLTNEGAYIRVTIKSASASDDGTYAVNNTQYIDTRIVKDIDNETTLYNIPVYDYTGLDYGTYTVTVLIYKEGMTVSSTTDDSGNTLADSTSGDDFYLDGIRIYGPVKTDIEVNSTYDTVEDVYEADGEANTTFLNVHDYLCSVSDALSDETFITVTDLTTGTITDYDDYFAVGPNNEVYLAGTSSSGSDGDTSTTDDSESTETTYQLSFYLLNWDSSGYDLYLGMKAPDGSQATVEIGGEEITLKNSADCYYDVKSYLKWTDISNLNLTDDDGEEITTAYKLTITGVTNLSAITWIKVTSSDEEYDIAFNVDIESENEDTETIATLDSNTIYMFSETAYAALTSADTDDEDAYDGEEDEDLQDEDGDSGDEDSDTENDSDTTEPKTENNEDTEEPESEEDEETLFEPESFTASISYLKLLKYASITVKTSSDVDYITINGTKVTGRSAGKSGTKTFSYSSMEVSSGTTFEIVAYDSDGLASESVTLTAK